jgi:hypothetical protein
MGRFLGAIGASLLQSSVAKLAGVSRRWRAPPQRDALKLQGTASATLKFLIWRLQIWQENSIADLGIAGGHRPQAETIEELPRWRTDELKRNGARFEREG